MNKAPRDLDLGMFGKAGSDHICSKSAILDTDKGRQDHEPFSVDTYLTFRCLHG